MLLLLFWWGKKKTWWSTNSVMQSLHPEIEVDPRLNCSTLAVLLLSSTLVSSLCSQLISNVRVHVSELKQTVKKEQTEAMREGKKKAGQKKRKRSAQSDPPLHFQFSCFPLLLSHSPFSVMSTSVWHHIQYRGAMVAPIFYPKSNHSHGKRRKGEKESTSHVSS